MNWHFGYIYIVTILFVVAFGMAMGNPWFENRKLAAATAVVALVALVMGYLLTIGAL